MSPGFVRTNRLEAGQHPPNPAEVTQRSPFRYFKTSPEIIRLPLWHDLFPVQGEEAAIDALAARLVGTVAAGHIRRPILDEPFESTPRGVQRRSVTTEPRLPPEKLARLDWLNDVSRLIRDIRDALAAPADDHACDVLIRSLQRALEDDADQPTRRAARHQGQTETTVLERVCI